MEDTGCWALRHSNKITSRKEIVRKATTFYTELYSRYMKKSMKMYTDSISG